MTDAYLIPDDLELRRAARERALELLYEAEIRGIPVPELVESQAWPPDELTQDLVAGVDGRRGEVDGLLEERVAPKWSLARLAAVDRAVLRLGTFELLAVPDRPQAIVINEAVVLARRFGTDDSPRFVNGVLSAVATGVRPDEGNVVDVSAGGPPRPDAVVFDLDGVLRHWDEDALAAGDDELGVPPGTLAGAAFHPPRLERQMRGEATVDEWYAETAAAVAEQHGVDPARAVEIMAGIGWRIDDTMVMLLEHVRERVPVALLSNASSRLREDLALSSLDNHFDAIVGSAELGSVKPEPESYQAAAEAVGVPAERCLMIDDRVENVRGAEAVGMRAVHFVGADELAYALVALGLVSTTDVAVALSGAVGDDISL